MKGYIQGGSSKERSAISRNPSLTKSNHRDASTNGYPHPPSKSQHQSSIPSSNRNSSHVIYQQQQQTPQSSKINESPFGHSNRIQQHPSALTSGNSTMRNRQDISYQQRTGSQYQQHQHGTGSQGAAGASRAESNTPGQRSPFLLNQNTSTNRGGASINSNTSSRKQTPEKNGKQPANQQIGKNEQSYTKYLRELDNYENFAHPMNNHLQQQQQKRKSDKTSTQQQQQQLQLQQHDEQMQKKAMKINLIRNAYDRRNTHVNPSLDSSDVPFTQLKSYIGRDGHMNSNHGIGTDNSSAAMIHYNDHSNFLGNPVFQQFSNFSTDLKQSNEVQSSKNSSNQFQHGQLDSYASNNININSKFHQVGGNYGRGGGVQDAQNYSLDRGYNNRNVGSNSNNVTVPIDVSMITKMKTNSHSGSANPQAYKVPAGKLGQQTSQQQQQGSKLKSQAMHNNNSTHFSRVESVFDDSFSEVQMQRMQYEGLMLNERRASLEMNKMLSSHAEIATSTTRVNLNDRSFDAGLDTTQNHIRTLSKVSTYTSAQISQAVSSEVAQLIEIGQKQFKENNLSEAIKNFQSAAKLDNSNLELNYLLGVCYLGKNEYQNSVKEFLTVIEKNPSCRKNVYLLISIAFKKLDNIPGAIRMLTKVIQNHPQYYDAFIYRGKLLIKEKSWEKAQLDFDSAIRIQPDKGLAYLGKADCLQSMNQFSEAVEVYTKAMKTENSIVVNALLKRAIALIADKRYDEALGDLAKVIQAEENNSEAYYFKGIAHYKQRNLSEASLSFEQSVKFNKSKKSVTKSLYEIARIKIEQRDFYQAYHTLSRSDYLDTDKKELEKFRLFTEGVIFLMKRKFKEAIDNFNLITQNFTLGDFLKPLFYVYRAYGYFCLGKHQLALYDYLACESSSNQSTAANSVLNSSSKDDVSSQYNKCLVEGILATQGANYDAGIQQFHSAQKIFGGKMEPAFYRALTFISREFQKSPNNKNNSTGENIQSSTHGSGQSRSSELIKSALREMDRAIEISDANANLFYLRAIVLCYLGQFENALTDIDKAITKSEDNEAKYFFLRGHSFSCCKQYKQAISDFSFAIQIDEKFADAFLERSKCYHFTDESNNAFADLQKYISLRPSDPNIHLLAGNLLFNKGEYKDAIRAYSHSDLIESSPNLLLLRSQCSVVLFNLPAALKDINTILAQQASKSLTFDKACLNGILNILDAGKTESSKQQSIFKGGLEKLVKAEGGFANEQNGRIFDKSDLMMYKGILEFYCGNYDEALRSFSLALTIFAAHQPHNIGGDVVILFNLALTQIALKKYRDAYETCMRFQNTVEDSSSPKSCFSLLLKILYHEKESKQLKNEQMSEEEMKSILQQGFVQENVETRLSEGLPYFQMNLSTISGARMRLMLPLPLVMPPDLHPVFQKSLIENIDVTMVENKPEAPWIRRNATGVIFTDNIQVFEHLDLETEENQKSSGEDERQIKIDRLKAKLMLDKDIENKLKNIKNGPKKQKVTAKDAEAIEK